MTNSLNPFDDNLALLEREYKDVNDLLQVTKNELDWFQGFNLDQANLNLHNTERMVDELKSKLQQAEQRLSALMTLANKLDSEASLGIDPRYWFSAERSFAKKHLAATRKDMLAAQSHIAEMKVVISNTLETSNKILEDMERARTFDPLLAQSIIVAQKTILAQIKPQLMKVRKRRDDFEDLIREQKIKLQELMREKEFLEDRIVRAEIFEWELSNASSGKERYDIHNKCREELGDDRPGNVLRECRSALRSVENNIEKIRTRIESLARIASFDIQHIVIDGNNLCFEGRDFIYLTALESLVPILAKNYKVTIIFDPSIRKRLSLSSKEIESRFPDAERVHIVAPGQKADETVIAATGDDPHAVALSNDKFIDFSEKPVVKEKRVLRHEIVGRVVYIHDLQIEAKFANNSNPTAV